MVATEENGRKKWKTENRRREAESKRQKSERLPTDFCLPLS